MNNPPRKRRTALLFSLIPASVLLLAAQVSAASDADHSGWTRVTEGPLTVYTQENPSQALNVIQSFARLRNALSQASPFHVNENAALKIIAFRSENEFDPYRLNPGSCAFYQQTGRAEYVVLQDLASAHREVSAHEFTHFVIAHSGIVLPLWMNEGLADFYSTFQTETDRVIFGRPVAGRLSILRSYAWLPLNALLEIGTSSSYYSDPQRMALFYSESWLLAHMLVASPTYAPRFTYFLRAIAEGKTASESFQTIYNKTLTQVQQDLSEYLQAQHLPLIEAPLADTYRSASAPLVLGVSGPEMDIMLSDLLVSNPNTQAGVEGRLAKASSQLPGNAEPEEALGYFALHHNNVSDARTHFRRAVERHSSDPNVYFYLAHLDRDAGAPSSQVIPLLERALALNPDLSDARLELALQETSDGNFEQALAALRGLTIPRPENAYTAAYTEAYCYAHLEKTAEARTAAHRALALAGTDRLRAEVSELMDYIDQQAQGLVASSAPSN